MAANRPSRYPDWTDGSSPKVQVPPAALIAQGWVADQAPPCEYHNWLWWLGNEWIKYFDQVLTTGTPDNVVRLLAGGNYSFDASSGKFAWSEDAQLAVPGIPDFSNRLPAGFVTMNDGDIAYTDIASTSQSACDLTSGNALLTNVSFTGNVQAGDIAIGANIPNGTTVLNKTSDSILLSAPVTGSAVQELVTFSAPTTLTVVVAPSASTFIPQSNRIMLARRVGSVLYVGVNTSQMILRDGESKPLLGSGYFTVYQAAAGQNLTAGQVVYISAGSSDGGRTAKAAYPLDCSAMFAATRSQFAGVVISDVTTGNEAQILFNGFYPSTVTTGLVYYADPANPGGITPTFPMAPNVRAVPVGFATSDDYLLVDGAASSQVAQPAYLTFFSEILGAGNGVNTTFVAAQNPLNASSLFVFVDGVNVPEAEWNLVSGNQVVFVNPPAVGQQVYAQYVIANTIYVSAEQEVPQGIIDGSNKVFALVGNPINQPSMFLYLNGLIVPQTEWSLSETAGVSHITFVSAPAIASQLNVGYLIPVGSGGGSGSVIGAANLGPGVGLFSADMGGVLAFKSITNAVDNGDGSVTVSGNAPQVHGTIGSPISFNPTVGLAPTTAMDQIWFLKSSGGEQAVTASLQIAVGTTIGQRLTLIGVSPTDFYTFQGTAGSVVNGLSLNGNCQVHNNGSLQLMWDGAEWYENSRR